MYFKWKHDVKNKIADLHIHSTLNKLLMHNFKASVKKKKKNFNYVQIYNEYNELPDLNEHGIFIMLKAVL